MSPTWFRRSGSAVEQPATGTPPAPTSGAAAAGLDRVATVADEPSADPDPLQVDAADAADAADAPAELAGSVVSAEVPEPDGSDAAAIGVASQPGSPSRAESSEQSEAWFQWCAQIGEQVLPVLADVHRRIPRTTSVMLCTADGYNLCALGVESAAVGRLAALSSSLYAVSSASVTDSARSGGKTLDYLTLASGSSLKVLTSVPHPTLGRLLLWASAEDVALGVLLVGVRAAADRIRRILALADQPPLD